ncbi:XrtA/PEP-CTERM system TPR-repeat protein PrsT [Pseudoduganella namucuonensis]|uniref:Putative PEP-CTERM system TPR-repeat lipoprotein n=1 Tax=Pseudoduganella namucuonensis TaxID=1035707 RepID=A0A1I7HD49_9BURK|nr:XrtA/PEP-CTERM system TPR-repeat protein PrsT [Pseudoduganella namucuonensis]SFU58650.1 putative PEP-CTERM system TPR-repeat lipoprotein [Pseudoduganella namucuonensis]
MPPLPPSLRAALAAALIASTLPACKHGADPDHLVAGAREYQRKGESKAAVIELKNALQHAPGHGAARMLLGDVYLDSGDVLSADKEFRRARELGAPAAEALPRLARTMLLQQQYEETLALMPAEGGAPELLALRGYALLGLHRRNEAAALFEQALSRQPGHVAALLGKARLALQVQDAAQAHAHVDAALAARPVDPDALRMKGDLLRMDGKLDQALARHLEIIKNLPGNLQARVDAAGIQIEAGRHAEAKAMLAAARKIAPGGLQVIYTQALLNFREKNLHGALEHLQLVLRAAPDHLPSLLLAGAVQYELNNGAQAEQYLGRFLQAEPGHLYAGKLMAGLALRAGKADEAIRLLAPLLEKHPDDVELLAAAGDAHMRARQFTRAAELLQRATELAPAKPALRAALGASHLGKGDGPRAIAELERALGMDAATPRAGPLLVLTHLRNGDHAKALAAVRTLEARGNNPAVQNLKGGVLLAQRDTEGARKAFEAALALEAGYLPALQNLAQLDTLARQPERARQRYEAALARDPRNGVLMTELARLATAQGRPAEAMAWLERASRQQPDALAPSLLLANYYLRAGERQKALTLAQKLHSAHPASAEALTVLAESQTASGDHEAALESHAALAAMQPESALAQMRLAGTLMGLNQRDEALAAVRKALELEPDLGVAQQTAVRLLTERRAWLEALEVARAAQRRHPDAGLGYKLEGEILMARGQAPQALKLFEQAYGREQSGPMAIAVHRALSATGRSGDAAQRIRQYLEYHPRDTPTRLYLASALSQARDYAGAVAQYERVVEADPEHVVALNDLAWASQQLKDKRALAYAERAYRLAPSNPAVADTLGGILLEQGQPERALPMLKKASDAAPRVGDIRFRYASALMRTGDRPAARRQFELLLADRDFPRQDEVKALLGGW